jgi:RNA 3'-terminal phosphate cyclase (ATP)
MTIVELDGSVGEGGGQILRTALSLSMCTGVPLRIERIRAKRPKPGLMRQHLSCVQAAQAISGAAVSGAELGSQSLAFCPGEVRAGHYRFAVGTAGSCTLVLQTVLPALMQAEGISRVELSGGTHNPMAPPFHFIDRSFIPLLRRMGVGVDASLRRHGFYPAGGGEIDVAICPPADGLRAFDLLERGEPRDLYAESLIPALPRRVAMLELQALADAFGWGPEQLRVPAVRQNEGPGNALMVTLAHAHVTEVFTSFGEKSLSAEHVAARVIAEVRAYQGACAAVGPHLADQLALPLALAVHRQGTSAAYTCSEMTEHARTNLAVIQEFLSVRGEFHRCESGWRVNISAHQR